MGFADMSCRLAIVSSHPIQYNAPAFRLLAADPDLAVKVFYGWTGPASGIDPGFGRPVEWDIPLLSGYEHTFVPNASREPGTHRFRGLNNPGMNAAIRAWQPDVILVYGWAFATHLNVMRAFRGNVPILFRGDSTMLDAQSALRAALRRTALRWVYRHVDVALYSGTLNREYYHIMGLRQDQLVWAPHAVDNARFAGPSRDFERDAAAWRVRLGIEPDDFVFVFAGKLIPAKDPHLLLNAFAQLAPPSSGRKPHLVFVGDGTLRKSLEAHPGSRTNVHFAGFQNQSVMPVAYRLGNVIVLPSRTNETWGLAVNEAMACGRPAIVSDRVGCAPDLVNDGTTGIVFEHGDAPSLARAMSRLLGDPTATKRMGQAASRSVERWSLDAYARVVADTAQRVAMGRG